MSKIFVISLHRSATQSTGQFLQEAGFSVCAWLSGIGGVDYQSQVVGHETAGGWIVDLLRPVFPQFDAFKDVPLPTLYRELDAAYPDARFIAVYRDPFSWVRSVRGHCGGRPLDPYERVQYWHYLEDHPQSIDSVSDEQLMQMHLRHHQEQIAHFAGRGNFLLVDISDPEIGAKLSNFLHVDQRPFPRLDIMPGRRQAAPEPPPPPPPPPPPRLVNTPSTRSRFHVLGVPHTVTHPDYTVCAFTQKVVKLCAMLKARGHYVIHYGHADSKVACDEHVSVTNDDVLRRVYGDWDWRVKGFPNFAIEDFVYQTFNANTIAAIERRKQHGDFLMATFGAGHHVVCGAHKDMVVCEPGIGYPGGQFAPFKVFESYAILHAYYGMSKIASMDNSFWYDVVIPNYYDLDDFEYSAEKDDYLLFVGRIGAGKGVHLAMQVAEATGDKLIIAGPGSIEGMGTRTSRPVAEYVECVGVAGVEQRKKLMSRAKAVLCLSTYLEPFCGVHVEAMLSGTPVISTDWGAFTEYNIHGVTGYRCRTFEQMVWAARNAHKINSAACRHWAAGNFAMERVAEMYDEYFYGVRNVIHDIGWYADNPHRTELDWLNKAWPPTSLHPADDEPSGWLDDPKPAPPRPALAAPSGRALDAKLKVLPAGLGDGARPFWVAVAEEAPADDLVTTAVAARGEAAVVQLETAPRRSRSGVRPELPEWIWLNCSGRTDLQQIVHDFYESKVWEGSEKTILCEIMKHEKSDKSTWHNYTTLYHHLFSPLQTSATRIFELGLGTNNTDVPSSMGVDGVPGASLRGWRHFFPNAEVYGGDVDKRILFEEERIHTFFVDQLDGKTIDDLWPQCGRDPFDVIIDDGLHEFAANQSFLTHSIHRVRPNGLYIVEDIFGGTEEGGPWRSFLKSLNQDSAILAIPIDTGKNDNVMAVIKTVD